MTIFVIFKVLIQTFPFHINVCILFSDLSSTTESCDNKNASGYCKRSYEWACVDPLYPWFKVDCQKLCKQCFVGSICMDDNKWGMCQKRTLGMQRTCLVQTRLCKIMQCVLINSCIISFFNCSDSMSNKYKFLI